MNETMSTNGRNDYEAVKADVATLRNQLGDLVAHVRGMAGKEALRRGNRALEMASEPVRERPLTSVVTALALGYIAGRFSGH
jgi:hypothetical protein